jgi:hypothetical protein
MAQLYAMLKSLSLSLSFFLNKKKVGIDPQVMPCLMIDKCKVKELVLDD